MIATENRTAHGPFLATSLVGESENVSGSEIWDGSGEGVVRQTFFAPARALAISSLGKLIWTLILKDLLKRGWFGSGCSIPIVKGFEGNQMLNHKLTNKQTQTKKLRKLRKPCGSVLPS